MQDNFSILEYLGEPEALAQLAEEAAELAQAALKLRRALEGKNHTPKTEEECRAALDEEIADVYVAMQALDILCDGEHSQRQAAIFAHKLERWKERLLNGCGERSGENG